MKLIWRVNVFFKKFFNFVFDDLREKYKVYIKFFIRKKEKY